MAQLEVLLPKMGESVAEATVIKWLKKPGDTVVADEPIIEIATDKVDTDVPAPANGILVKQLFNEGDIVQVGQAIAIISYESTEADVSNNVNKPESRAENTVGPKQMPDFSNPIPVNTPIKPTEIKLSNSTRFYSPLVKNIATKEGLTQADLDLITGTGANERVTKTDILTYLDKKSENKTQPIIVEEQTDSATEPIVKKPKGEGNKFTPAPEQIKNIVFSYDPENVEIIEMDRMRRMIADHMTFSKKASPHITTFVEADVTAIVTWREKVKKEFEEKQGEKLTFTPIFIEAIAKALKDFPMVNISVDGYNIIRHKQINIGMAVALPTGNLIVPVVKNADELNLVGLAKQVNKMSALARINKLSPDDLQGGTFTMTNVGAFGNVTGTPILNQPQAAILAIGTIKKKPAVIETPDGDTIGIRHMMYLSASYDHRVIDGALGCSFLRRIGDYLEQYDIKRKI